MPYMTKEASIRMLVRFYMGQSADANRGSYEVFEVFSRCKWLV